MKTNSPTHEEVTQRAKEIWQTRGCLDGCDTEIWLEAERQLLATASVQNALSDAQVRGAGTSPGEVASGDPIAADPTPGGAAAKVVQQKRAARAPKFPGTHAPKPLPPETGKPLWDRQHSS